MRVLATSLIVLLAAQAPALAQYTGPGSQPAQSSIKQILDNPVDDMNVVLRGTIVRQVSSDKYIFSDGTGEIRVEIDRRLFPASPVTDKVTVEISGEVEKDFLESPEIDVDTLHVTG